MFFMGDEAERDTSPVVARVASRRSSCLGRDGGDHHRAVGAALALRPLNAHRPRQGRSGSALRKRWELVARMPKSVVTVTPLAGSPGLPAVTPILISRNAGSRTLWRWPGLAIHWATMLRGVAALPMGHARFSPTTHRVVLPGGGTVLAATLPLSERQMVASRP
jgi:hypothetical protein